MLMFRAGLYVFVFMYVRERRRRRTNLFLFLVITIFTKNSKYSYDTRKSFCGHLQYIGTVYWHILQTYTTNL